MSMVNDAIKVFAKGTHEYDRLEEAAEMMSQMSPNGWHYSVQNIYFDYGQGWMWTTVVCDHGDGYQALTPKEQASVVYGDLFDEDMEDTLNAVFDDKYCPDC